MKKSVKTKILSIILVAATLAGAFCLSSCSSAVKPTKEDTTVVGKVGNFEVLYEELRFLAVSYRKEVTDADALRALIYDKIRANYAVLTLAAKYSISPSDKEIKSKIDTQIDNQIIDDFGGSFDEYLDSLVEYSLTDHYNRFVSSVDLVGDRLYYKMLEAGDLTVSDEELEAKKSTDFAHIYLIYRDRSGNGFTEEENLAKMRRALAELDGGVKDFTQAIGSYSTSSVTETTFVRGEMAEEVEEAVLATSVGDYSDIIETPAGFFIIYRVNVTSPLSDLREKYLSVLYNDAINETMETLTFEPNEFCASLDLLTIPGSERGKEPMKKTTVVLIILGAVVVAGSAVFVIMYIVMRKTGKVEAMKLDGFKKKKNKNKSKNKK